MAAAGKPEEEAVSFQGGERGPWERVAGGVRPGRGPHAGRVCGSDGEGVSRRQLPGPWVTERKFPEGPATQTVRARGG